MKKNFTLTSVATFMILELALGSASAADFTTTTVAILDNAESYEADSTVDPDGRCLTVWSALSPAFPDTVNLFMNPYFTDGTNGFTEIIGPLYPDPEGNAALTLPLEIESGGGATWALAGRNLDGGKAEMTLVKIYPRPESYEFLEIRELFGTERIDLAIASDGLPRAVIANALYATVSRIAADGEIETKTIVPGEGLRFGEVSISAADGQIAVSAAVYEAEPAGVRQSWLRLYQVAEEEFFNGDTEPTFSLVATSSALNSNRVAGRQRSAFVGDSVSPMIIFRDEIEGVGKLAVRDPSTGWQLINLPTVDERTPDAVYVDIAAESSGSAHMVWSSGILMYGRYQAGGSIGACGIPEALGNFCSVGVGSNGTLFASAMSRNTEVYRTLPTDLTDFDKNGFNVLEEEAFGIAPGSDNLERRPTPVIYTAGDGRKYRAISYWRKPGGTGTHPYVADDIAYTTESSIDLETWFSTPFFMPFAESFTISGRGQIATYRTAFDIDTINDSPTFLRVRVRRLD